MLPPGNWGEKMEPIICGFDIETTGLDFDKDYITEIGWMIKKWKDPKPLAVGSKLVYVPAEISKEITELTKITGWHLEAAPHLKSVLEEFVADLEVYSPSYMLAHYGNNFDKPFLLRKAKAENIKIPDIPWLDSKEDIEWPYRSTHLNYLAAECGFLNPFPHAALFDVATMFRVAETQDIGKIIQRSKTPWIVVSARVSYQNRDMAKNRRYRWESLCDEGHYPKQWVKKIKEDELEREMSESQFEVVRLS